MYFKMEQMKIFIIQIKFLKCEKNKVSDQNSKMFEITM